MSLPGRTLRLAVACLIAVLAIACGDDPALVGPTDGPTPIPTAVDSGIRGLVRIGPCATPSGATSSPCDSPYAAELVILDGDFTEVARLTAGADGRFEVTLPPGQYSVTPMNGDPYPTSPVQTVSVVAGAYTDINVDYNSGLDQVNEPSHRP